MYIDVCNELGKFIDVWDTKHLEVLSFDVTLLSPPEYDKKYPLIKDKDNFLFDFKFS